MTQQSVELTRSGAIATITLANPPTHTLTAGGVSEIHRLLDGLEDDRGLRVLVFRGGGDAGLALRGALGMDRRMRMQETPARGCLAWGIPG